jgi:type II secretory pathway pseudopilin PulG
MDQTQLLVVIVVIAVIAVAGILFFAMRKRRSQKLRERFGPNTIGL